jgi:hypothetical protein
MTITLASSVQAWFTSGMKTITRREDKYDRAKRILSTPRAVTTIESNGADYWLGYVEGDHGTYKVCAVSADYAEALMGDRNKRVHCPCRAGRAKVLCAHAIIGEEMRLRGEGS